MDIVTIDFETFYNKEFSLSKITTEEYIRSDLFETIGVSVKVNDHPADWYSGDDFHTFLNSLDYSDKAILCHHAAFDGAILSWRYGIRPKFWFDTLSMARPTHQATVGGSLKRLAAHFKLGEKGTDVVRAIGMHRADFSPQELANYGAYCINDNELTYKLFKKLQVGFPVSELLVIDQTIRMFTEPRLDLDRSALEKHLAAVQAQKQVLLDKLGGGEKAKKILMSNVKFAALLERMNVNPPTKISPTTDKLTYAFAKTDQGFQDLLQHENPAVVAITEARMGVKSTIEETRTKRLLDISTRGALPIMLNYYGAHTGRFSGGDKINPQNFSARKNTAIRSAIRAPEGHKVVVCDSSQIEARILAFIAGQDDLVQAFREGRDVYTEFAARIYGIAPEHVTDKQRFVGKTCILGLGYGMGWAKFKDTLKTQAGIEIDEHEAKRIVYFYRNVNYKIKGLWKQCDHVLRSMVAGQEGILGNFVPYGPNGIVLPNGMRIKYNALCVEPEEVNSTFSGFVYLADARQFNKLAKRVVAGTEENIAWTNIYGGKVVENVVQALARIVVADQMVAIGQHHPVVLQVHDENVSVVRTEEAKATQQLMERVMSTPPAWAPELPIACESAIGENYGECK